MHESNVGVGEANERNIVRSWLNVHRSTNVACNRLNADLDSDYLPSRVGEWRRGDRPIPHRVYDVMLRDVVFSMRGEHVDRSLYYALRQPVVVRRDQGVSS